MSDSKGGFEGGTTHQEARQRAVKLYKYICSTAIPLDDTNTNIMNSRRPPSGGFFLNI